MRKKKTPKGQDEIRVSCLKCGHEHVYDSMPALEAADIATPCSNCGFLFLQYLANKLDAMKSLLRSDPKASALIKQGRLEEFKKYMEEKTGLS